MSNKHQIDFYNKFHKRSVSSTRVISKNDFTYWNILRILDPLLIKYKPQRILDYGCGVGQIDMYLSTLGYFVTGVDISTKAIRVAKATRDKLRFQTCNFYTVGDKQWQKDKYSMIICSEVFEHLHKYKMTFEHLTRILKKGGIMFITVPSLLSPLKDSHMLKVHDKKVGHLRRFSNNGLEELLRKKFIIIQKKDCNGVIRTLLFMTAFGSVLLRVINKIKIFNDVINTLDDFLVPFFGADQIIIVAIKK